MTHPPIGMHFFTVRREARADPEGVLRRVAEIGYRGVEFEGLHGMTTSRLRELADELGLTIVSLGVEEDEQQTLREALELGVETIVTGVWEPESLAVLRAEIDSMNAFAAECTTHGIRLALHNHWQEFEQLEGRRVYDVLLDELDSAVFMEVDYYWAETAGVDSAELLRSLGERARIVHFRDGDGKLDGVETAVGAGEQDIAAIVAAAPHAEWHIVECEVDGDQFAALADSYRFLTAPA